MVVSDAINWKSTCYREKGEERKKRQLRNLHPGCLAEAATTTEPRIYCIVTDKDLRG